MRYLGVDYGTKKIGIAISDEGGQMAFPHSVIKNEGNIANTILDLVESEGVDEIVFGLSVDQKGEENKLMVEVRDVIGQISIMRDVPIHLENESYTSFEADRDFQFEGKRRGDIAKKKAKKNEGKKDDSAAALILQRFLDKR